MSTKKGHKRGRRSGRKRAVSRSLSPSRKLDKKITAPTPPALVAQLTEAEEQALITITKRISEFMHSTPASKKYFSSPPTREELLRFVVPKKFRIEKTVECVRGFVEVNEVFGGYSLEDSREYIAQGHTVVNPLARDKEGRGIFYVLLKNLTPKFYDDWESQAKATFLMLDTLLEDPLVQRAGIIMVLDMKGVPFRLDKGWGKFFEALQDKYPAKGKKCLVVNSPWFAKAVFKFVTLFLSQKMRDRVQLISKEELTNFIDRKFIPQSLGGEMTFTCVDFLKQQTAKAESAERAEKAGVGEKPEKKVAAAGARHTKDGAKGEKKVEVKGKGKDKNRVREKK